MAELSPDEASRLARGFLTGKAAEAEVNRLQVAVQVDEKAALELLRQMQTALDDVAPAGLTRDQWAVVDSRVHALIQPRIKSGGLAIFAALFNLFKRKPKEDGGTTRVKRRGGGAPEAAPTTTTLPEPTPPPVQESAPDLLGETMGMEDMAPIAAPAPAAAMETAPVSVPATAKASKAEKAAKPAGPSSLSRPGVRWSLAALLVVAGLGGLFWTLKDPLAGWWARFTAKKEPVVAALPQPAPTPKPAGPPRRALPGPGGQEEPLPAALPEATPRPAGSWDQPQATDGGAQPAFNAPTRQ